MTRFTRRLNLDLEREPRASDFRFDGNGTFSHIDDGGNTFSTVEQANAALSKFERDLGWGHFVVKAVLVRWTGFEHDAFTVAVKTGYSPS